MKSLLLTGGILGFVCGFAFSFIHKEAWPVCLWHGGLSAFLASVLLAWWNQVWNESLKDAAADRQHTSETLLSTTSTHPKTS
jgi:hypothetical protein